MATLLLHINLQLPTSEAVAITSLQDTPEEEQSEEPVIQADVREQHVVLGSI